MFEYLSQNGSQILDGLLFGLGVLAVYLGAVFTGALIRSLGGAGSRGLTLAGRYMQGWFDYLRGDDRNTINVTLNTIVDDHLKFDTLVADRRIWYVWPNSYRIQMIRRAVQNMRQLIDDLLDLTKIESGIKLDLQPVTINAVVVDCLESLRPNVQNKQMTVISEVNDSLPNVMGDKSRLRQVLMNLIGNAVKYTPPEGWIKVSAEPRGNMLRLTIQDNGLGISPEDQIHIFDRFYRVRRPETDSIEGTGLGLAIVKSLVEAHNGQIGLESRLGEGSTFYLTLPVAG